MPEIFSYDFQGDSEWRQKIVNFLSCWQVFAGGKYLSSFVNSVNISS